MLREEVATSLCEEYQKDGLVFPAYESYCFGNVPGTVRTLLDAGGERPLPADVFEGVHTDVERVVLILVDGYGLDAWRRDRAEVPFLDRLTGRGTVTPLTSIYPSETAAAITTLESGQLPCEHGRIGWNVYEPETDRTFLTFGGEVKSGDEPGTVAPETSAGVEFHYTDLEDRGIDCHRLQPFDNGTTGVTQHTFDELTTFHERLTAVVEESEPPAYVYGYLPDVDHVSHEHGTDSEAFQETIVAVFRELSEFVSSLDAETASETLLLVTADHGHVDTDPERNIDLSERSTLVENLRRHGDGEPIRMAGSMRNVHLHLQDGTVEETRRSLAGLDANVWTRDEILDLRLFGDREPSSRFHRRCGDLVLSHHDLGTWFGDVEPDALEEIGMHGGLHPREMLVPFAAVRADRLQ